MFSKIVIEIEGSKIELHLHEIVKLTLHLVSQETGTVPERVSDAIIANHMIDILLCLPSNSREDLEVLYKGDLDAHLFVPASFSGMNLLKHWLYIAKYCANKPEQKNLSAWWLLVAGRLLHVDLSERDLYVSDHGALTDIISDVKPLAIDFPWVLNAELTYKIMQLQTSFEGYRILLSRPKEQLVEKTIYIYIQNEGTSDQFLEYQVIDINSNPVTGTLNKESLGKKYYDSIIKKIKDSENIRKLTKEEKKAVVETTYSHGHTKSMDELRQELEQIKNDYVRAVINDTYDSVKFLDPSITEAKFLEIQRQHQKDPNYVNLELAKNMEIVAYLIDILLQKFLLLTFSDREFFKQMHQASDESTANETPIHILLESYIKRFVLGEIAKEINLGRRESLYRPVLSYGKKEVGDAYHEFANSVRIYSSSPNALSPQELAKSMRNIIKGIDDDCPTFLPNLTVAWFIAEGARNPTSVLTSMMLIDLIENGIELIHKDSKLNLYDWQYTLIHPYNHEPTREVRDFYGAIITEKKGVTGSQRIGGSHPMAHDDSATQGKSVLQEKTNLNIVRQKEGSLILHWLFEHIKHANPALNIHLISIDEEGPAQKPSYREIDDILIRCLDKKIKDKESDIRRIKLKDPNADITKLQTDIENYINQKKKQKLIEGLVIPLLKLRLNSTRNLMPNPSQIISHYINDMLAIKINFNECDFVEEVLPKDGDCLFASIIHAVKRLKLPINKELCDTLILRETVANGLFYDKDNFDRLDKNIHNIILSLLKNNQKVIGITEEFRQKLLEPIRSSIYQDSDQCMIFFTKSQIQRLRIIYCENLKKAGPYVSDLEIAVVSERLDIRIEVYTYASARSQGKLFSKYDGISTVIKHVKTYNEKASAIIHLMRIGNHYSFLIPTPLGLRHYESLFFPRGHLLSFRLIKEYNLWKKAEETALLRPRG